MDHFLWAYNPLKPISLNDRPISYIIDTVKDVWVERTIENDGTHHFRVVKGAASHQDTILSCTRMGRWYNSWLQQMGQEAEVRFSWPPSTVNQQPSTTDDTSADPQAL